MRTKLKFLRIKYFFIFELMFVFLFMGTWCACDKNNQVTIDNKLKKIVKILKKDSEMKNLKRKDYKIVMFEFHDIKDRETVGTRYISNYISNELEKNKFQIIDRERYNKIFEDIEINNNKDKLLMISKILQPNSIISGIITEFSSIIDINVKVTDAEDGVIIASDNIKLEKKYMPDNWKNVLISEIRMSAVNDKTNTHESFIPEMYKPLIQRIKNKYKK